MKNLVSYWNLDFRMDTSFANNRRNNIRRTMQQNLTARPKGNGNRAWKRAAAIQNEPGTITWPDYALSNHC